MNLLKDREINNFLALIIITIFIIYFIKIPEFNIFYLVFLLIIYFISNNDSFWFAFFFIVTQAPGKLFLSGDLTYGLYLETVRHIHISEIFVLVALIKAVFKKEKYERVFFSSYLWILGILLLITYLNSFIFFEMDVIKHFRVIRLLLPFSLLYSIPKLLNNEESYYKLYKLIFFSVLLIFFTQVFELFIGQSLASFLSQGEKIINPELGVQRQLYGPFLIINAFIAAMYYLKDTKNNFFSPNYLITIFLVSLFSIFLSATRGYFLSIVIMLILFFLLRINKGKLRGIFAFSVTIIVAIIALLFFIPKLNLQIIAALNRFFSIQLLLEGDYTAGGTLIRITERAPLVLAKWAEQPLLGYGFSNTYFEYFDIHVSIPSLLLNSGIIGLLIWFSFFIYFPNKIYRLSILYNQKNLRILIIGFIGFLIAHFTSTTVFYYLIGFDDSGFSLLLYFCFADLQIKNSISKFSSVKY